jgi:cbb3-type cytochrome oxidase subunit 3
MEFLNIVRSAVTVAGLLLFVVLVAHTWRRARRAEHCAAAALPFADSQFGSRPAVSSAEGQA